MNALVFACATCFGTSDSLMAKGMNMGIFFMMGIVLFVLSGFLAFIIYLAIKSKATS